MGFHYISYNRQSREKTTTQNVHKLVHELTNVQLMYHNFAICLSSKIFITYHMVGNFHWVQISLISRIDPAITKIFTVK